MKVSASFLSSKNIPEDLTKLNNTDVDYIHVDIMDGKFVPNKTMPFSEMKHIGEFTNKRLDIHLMVNNPDKVIDRYIKNGADIITVHYEVFDDNEKLIKTLKRIKSKGKMVGLAIDLGTDIKVIDAVIKYLDLVLIMSVKAGKGGQKFDKKAIDKIKYVRKLNPEILIEVDGGINKETAPLCVKAGADILCAGTYIYNNDTYEAIQTLKGKNG